MGLTFLKADVGNPASPDTTETLEFLVDSGAIYSVVAADVLDRLGIKALTEHEFILANGSRITRKKGIALFKYGERIGGADILFGEPGDATILGKFALTALGFWFDPLRRELKPLPMILASSSCVPFQVLPCDSLHFRA